MPRLTRTFLGRVPYGRALALQYDLRSELIEGRPNDGSAGHILGLTHPPVITVGKRGSIDDITDPKWLRDEGVEVYRIERGGELTYHGPGQLVVYPVLDLEALSFGIVDVVRKTAATAADVMAEYGISADYSDEAPGLWVEGPLGTEKIASVGMRVHRDVTIHGIAINLANDVNPFSRFVPCGMPETRVTRVADHIDSDPPAPDEFFEAFCGAFEKRFDSRVVAERIQLPPEARTIPADVSGSEIP